jgi:glycosyltransferase involved in cell wall biosynthesis
MNPDDVHLTLFLTRAVPLRFWDDLGILDREIALYVRLRPQLAGLSIVTGGGADELRFQERLPGIRILYNRWGLSHNLYSLLAPFLHWRALREATVYKTNQWDGAWTAIIASRLHHHPVIARAGYGWALHARRDMGETRKARLIYWLERWSLRSADRVIVTTQELRDHVVQEHRVPAERITVTPNYVDTDHFQLLPDVLSEPGQVVFVGGLRKPKNLPALLRAVNRVPTARLMLVGDGPLRSQLEYLVRDLGITERVIFAGRKPSSQLPGIVNRAQVFALTSYYEGHPKALIEAMACGVAVLGTDVEGIQNVIRHEETGLLCPPSPEGIAAALTRLLEDAPLREKLGRGAREFAVREYSLDRIAQQELALLAEASGK